ncbi:MAG: efflux RND transporter periplasmic adaptor subunit [Gammaproteobacteria bacterium]|nr:efflux RND transporter periplasmic adaptor subunit [Gammaproteobacteria bacterium]MBU1979623.1 efflux RND transporter periplasmic adaptor subunit [Gammaproteobacteria bacterium]
MKNSQKQHKNGTWPMASWYLAGTLFVLLLAGCGDKQQVPGSAVKESKQAEPASKAAGTAKQKEEGGEKRLVLSADEIKKAGITLKSLKLEDRPEYVSVTATIQPNRNKLAYISPRIPGRIVKVGVEVGDAVRKGQVLAVLDSVELGEARSVYLQAASEEAVARAGFERAQRLHADNIIPEKDYLRARAEHEKAKASFRAASDKLRMVGVEPDKLTGSVFPLVAPFAGSVIEKHAVLGSLREPEEIVFTVADLSMLWVEADLAESDLAKVQNSALASVAVAAYPGEVFNGRLVYVSSVMDKATRTVKARIEVPNRDGRLKPEMFATATIYTAFNEKVLLVPENAVLLVQGQATLFVAEKGGYEARPVEIGERRNGLVIIKSGVIAGENVVVSGAYALKARLLKSQIGDAD